MSRNVTIFVAGVVTIGIVTALVLPGRNTANVIRSSGTAASGLLGTAISGRK